MADIDLKTETPDTSLPSTGFLFGADSQSAASPSVYSTQAVATTLLGSTSLTGATVTADSPVLNLAQTWNNSGVTFTGLKFNVPTDSSASGSLLMDLQVGGSSKFKVAKDGEVTSALRFKAPFCDFSAYMLSPIWLANSNTGYLAIGTLSDAILSRRAAANLRLGTADAAAPVAQTLSVQSVVAGTTNTAGANLTITGSQGTGTGAGGSIVFQVAPAGSSGTAQNALATALTIDSTRLATFSSHVAIGANSDIYTTSGRINIASGVNWGLTVQSGRVSLANSTDALTWGSGSNAADVYLYRDYANTLALRNGANAQTFRVYNTTDGTNSEFGSIKWNSNVLQIGTEATGTGANRNVEISAAGQLQLTNGAGIFILFKRGFELQDSGDIKFPTSTGAKIGTATNQKIGFWNATPIVQPTTAVAAATVAATGTGDVVAASTTFDGYTIPQIVKALRNAGLLA